MFDHSLPGVRGNQFDEQKSAALKYLSDAWHDAIVDGVEADALAQVALFTAMMELVATYGEDAVADMTSNLPDRIRHGDFTIDRTMQ